MRNSTLFISMLLFLDFQIWKAQTEITDYNDIPPDRIAASGWGSCQCKNPLQWEAIKVQKLVSYLTVLLITYKKWMDATWQNSFKNYSQLT